MLLMIPLELKICTICDGGILLLFQPQTHGSHTSCLEARQVAQIKSLRDFWKIFSNHYSFLYFYLDFLCNLFQIPERIGQYTEVSNRMLQKYVQIQMIHVNSEEVFISLL